ncbi:MAG: ABC transporter permease [Microcella sp.]|uniref:ABC transporter permease n=1 Tax=Microcella sp. TaxID=1913979 RepID=UPI003315188E
MIRRIRPITVILTASLVAAILLIAIFVPTVFSGQNLANLALASSITMIAATGQTLVLMSRNLDLSQGAMVMLVALSTGMIHGATGAPIALLLPFAILLGALLGAVNGFIVAYLAVPSIIATLGTAGVFRGIGFFVADGSQVSRNDLPVDLIEFAKLQVLSVPAPFYLAILIAAAFVIISRSTVPGRTLVAVGYNEPAARLRGIATKPVIVSAFVLSGVLCGAAALLFAGIFGNVNPSDATGLELQTIAAAIIGGTSIAGGKGNFIGTALGALLLALILNVLRISDIDPLWQLAIQGLVILVAATIAHRSSGMRGRVKKEMVSL